MPGNAVVPADILFPDLPPTKFIATLNGSVLFSNFAVDSPKPVVPFHTDFIRERLVPFLIAQIDQLGFDDRIATIHLFGFASATGTAAHNRTLSQARAQATGDAIAVEFDRQKDKSKFAHNIQIEVDPHGEGDEAGRLQLALIRKILGRAPTSAEIEQQEFALRSVRVRIQAAHRVVDDDKKVLCRELFSVKFETKKVPANLLEQTIDDIAKQVGPVLSSLLGTAFDIFKSEAKSTLKSALKELEVGAPELFVIFESIDFIVPADITLAFEFKDGRGRTATYKYTGEENKRTFTILDALAKFISFTKWLEKLDEALKKFKLIRAIKSVDLDKFLNKVLKDALKSAHSLVDKGGSLRAVIGDPVADILLAIFELGAKAPLRFDVSDFALVIFGRPGVFDVSTFNGPARTETREFLGKANVRLDFLGEGPEGRLGFRATTRIQTRFSFSTGLLGFGISKGFLLVLPPSHAASR
jgi:hypothetical protein